MKIALPKNEFTDIEIGDNQLFKITAAVYDDVSRKVRVTYRDQAGNTHSEFFKLYNADAQGNLSPNDKGLKMFAILYRGVTGEKDADEIDVEDLKGLYFRADVTQGSSRANGDGYWLNVYSKRPTTDTFENSESFAVDEW